MLPSTLVVDFNNLAVIELTVIRFALRAIGYSLSYNAIESAVTVTNTIVAVSSNHHGAPPFVSYIGEARISEYYPVLLKPSLSSRFRNSSSHLAYWGWSGRISQTLPDRSVYYSATPLYNSQM